MKFLTPVMPARIPGCGQIGPFVRINAVIIEFLGAVLVTNVAQTLGANRGVAFTIGGDHRRSPLLSTAKRFASLLDDSIILHVGTLQDMDRRGQQAGSPLWTGVSAVLEQRHREFEIVHFRCRFHAH